MAQYPIRFVKVRKKRNGNLTFELSDWAEYTHEPDTAAILKMDDDGILSLEVVKSVAEAGAKALYID